MGGLSERNNNRHVYIDMLRIAASFAVVVIHVVSKGVKDFDITSFSWDICNIADGLSRFSVPVFVMISGCFFLNPDKTYSLKKIATKILRLIIAFFVWSIIYGVTDVIFSDGESLSSVLYGLILDTVIGKYHMWYIFLIIGLYILSPVLKRITAEKKITEYFLIITFVFTFCLVFAEKIFKELMGTNVFVNLVSEVLSSIVPNFNLDFLSGYVFYFIMGYYLNQHSFSKKVCAVVYSLGTVSGLTIILGTYLLSAAENKLVETFYDYLGFPCCILSISIFIFVKNIFSNVNLKEKTYALVCSVSKLTFGIYLVHVLIIDLFEKVFGLYIGSFNTVLSVMLLIVLTYIISLIITYILNKIPVVKKYMI